MNYTGIYVKPMEIFANELDITLLEAALNDLMDKITLNGDPYEITGNVSNLLAQLQIIKGE